MPAKKSKSKSKAETRFFEIINWKKAQPRMKEGPNDWMKLYTSLLEYDGFCSMDDSGRMLIVAIWLYAARTGQFVFPADPNWLARKIPMLNSKPDLDPLLNATDIYGNPTPFIGYCKPPAVEAKAEEPSEPSSPGVDKKTKKKAKKRKTKKKKIVVLEEEKREEESREEQSREEKKREEKTKPLRVSEEKNRKRKEQISSAPEQTASAQPTAATEPEKSVNPMDSEAGSAKRHVLPRPTRSALGHRGPEHIGAILNDRFKEHWQDTDAERFGWSIVQALGYSVDPNNFKSRSEWGAFASWWSRLKKSAPVMVHDEIRAKAIQKADYLRRKGKSAKNRSAVWFHVMNGVLGTRGITMNQTARASP